MNVYYAMQCVGCGQWQNCEIRGTIQEYTFKCRHDDCRKTRKAKQEGTFGIAIKKHGPYANAKQAQMMVVSLNTPAHMKV